MEITVVTFVKIIITLNQGSYWVSFSSAAAQLNKHLMSIPDGTAVRGKAYLKKSLLTSKISWPQRLQVRVSLETD